MCKNNLEDFSSTLDENWENPFENKVILRTYMNLFNMISILFTFLLQCARLVTDYKQA